MTKSSVPKPTSRQIIRAYARAIKLTFEAGPDLAVGLFVAALFSALTAPLQAWIAKVMIDQITTSLASNSAITVSALLPPVIAFILIRAVGQLAESMMTSLVPLVSEQTMLYTNVRVIQKSTTMDTACFDNASFYDQLSMARDQMFRISQVTSQSSYAIAQLLALISLLGLLVTIHWVVPFIVVIMTLPTVIAKVRATRVRATLWMSYTPSRRMVDYVAYMLGTREYNKEIRLFQLGPHLLDRMRSAVQQFMREIRKLAFAQERRNAVLPLLTLTGTAGIWLYVASEALARRRTVGDLALTFQVLDSSRRSLDQIANSAAFLLENIHFLVALFDYLDRPAESYPGALKRPAPSAKPMMPNLRGALTFHNVSFRYPGSDKDTLRNISFTLQPGERIALVGENGAGKTTLIKLLTRLYDPTEGSITCDGVDLREIAPEVWQRELGVVFQDFVRYDLSARDNIGFGKIESYLSGSLNGQLTTAAEQAGANEVIAELPQGYDTMLGNRFEGGIDLSGGQWQKLALARAFVRNANLLVLDEPTAALDAFAEAAVFNHFAELTKGKTTVFVTHRLSSVKMAQMILVLKDGVLIESGDHATLMARAGEYASMYTLQAERYA